MLPAHVRCADHGLVLIVTSDLPNFFALAVHKALKSKHDKAIGACKKLWALNKTSERREKLKAYLTEALSYPVISRWTSLYKSISKVISYEEKLLSNDFQVEVGMKPFFTRNDFAYLNEYAHIMKPLMDSIYYLQGEKECFYGHLMPNLITLRNTWERLKSTRMSYVKPVLEEMLSSLNRRFDHFFHFEGQGMKAAIATTLHPNFKCRWMAQFPSHERERVERAIVDEISKLPEIEMIPADVVQDRYDFGEERLSQSERNQQMTAELIVKNYLQEPTTEDLKTLNRHPLIKKLFLKTNTPLPAQASVERLFSYATMMELPKFNRLNDDNFQLRVLVKVNQKLLK